MTYQETLDWMFDKLPMYQQKGVAAYNAKLEGITKFVTNLGQPQNKFKSIHVAGTNGKGSSSHMLASILQEAGYKVGLYTSPHLKDFRERIRINGVPVEESFVVRFIAENNTYLTAEKLSFFEMTVGMAFDYFAKQRVDFAVVEVGLGGRLDATNIITPEVSLITNIGYDHVAILGDTLAKIAAEKAGIIKPGVPVVVSETHEETALVFKTIASERQSPLQFADAASDVKSYTTDLMGSYQVHNLKGVVATIKSLKIAEVAEEALTLGLRNVVKNTNLQGRWQQLQERPKVICDTAHNVEGLRYVVKALEKQVYHTLHMVVGMVSDKDIQGVLAILPKNAVYYFCTPNIMRALKAEELQEQAAKFQLNGKIYSSVNEALTSAKANAAVDDVIFVGGSTFVVAEII